MEYKLGSVKTSSLIFLIESNQHNTSFSLEELLSELDSRNIPKNVLNDLILKENEMIARMMLESDDITNKEVNMHKSHFLTENEVKNIYIAQLEEYMRYKDGFRFDVWSYSIGGV